MPRNGVLYQKTSNQVFCYLIDKRGAKGVHYCVLWATYHTDGAKLNFFFYFFIVEQQKLDVFIVFGGVFLQLLFNNFNTYF